MSNPAEDTLEKVSGEFEAEMLSELQAGRDQALSALEAAKRETRAEVAKVLEAGAKQAEALKRQIIGAAELEARNSQLKAVESAVVDVFEAATRELREGAGARYEKALAGLVDEGVGIIGPKSRVYCRSKDRKAVSAALRGHGEGQSKPVLEEKEIETIGGVVMTSADGSVRFDNTFEARLERMRPTLRMQASAILTGT